MSILIIDGYNTIHAIPSLEKELEKGLLPARKALIDYCLRYKGKRKDISSLYIVFDGKDEYSDVSPRRVSGLRIIFTRTNEDADDRILALIKKHPETESLTIVSNDNYVFNNARIHGARVISVDSFARELRKKRMPPGKQMIRDKIKLPREKAREITREYKKHLGLK